MKKSDSNLTSLATTAVLGQTPRSNQQQACPICGGTGKYEFTGNDLMFGGSDSFAYFQCHDCHSVYQNPMSDSEKIASFYPDNYTVYDEHIKLKPRSILERAVLNTRYGYKHLNAPSLVKALAPLLSIFQSPDSIAYEDGGRLLDIGCGNGRFLLRMQEIGWQVEGVEFNETAVTICRQHQLKVFHGKLDEADLPENSFNLISARHVIEHVPDPNAFIEGIVHLLRPGGRLHIRTPNSTSLGRSLFGRFWYANDVPRHLILFSRNNLEMLARNHGLEPVTMHTKIRPKLLLNSLDYKYPHAGKPSRKNKLKRILAKSYIPFAKYKDQGDELFAVFRKR